MGYPLSVIRYWGVQRSKIALVSVVGCVLSSRRRRRFFYIIFVFAKRQNRQKKIPPLITNHTYLNIKIQHQRYATVTYRDTATQLIDTRTKARLPPLYRHTSVGNTTRGHQRASLPNKAWTVVVHAVKRGRDPRPGDKYISHAVGEARHLHHTLLHAPPPTYPTGDCWNALSYTWYPV